MKDLITTAVEAGQFKTLAKALNKAELVDALQLRGPYTVFAPTDEAFAKLPPKTLEAIMKDKDQLISLLKYHVTKGKLNAQDVVSMQKVDTLHGKTLSVDATKGVKINNANIVKPNVQASNGVIHVIDSVLTP